jgi:hypothetical protein
MVSSARISSFKFRDSTDAISSVGVATVSSTTSPAVLLVAAVGCDDGLWLSDTGTDALLVMAAPPLLFSFSLLSLLLLLLLLLLPLLLPLFLPLLLLLLLRLLLWLFWKRLLLSFFNSSLSFSNAFFTPSIFFLHSPLIRSSFVLWSSVQIFFI